MSCAGGTERGFTLIEILAVIVLIALFAAVLTPNLFIGSERDLDQGVERMRDLLSSVGEHSVFSGELMGVRLEEERVTPMRFDPVEQKFVPFGGASRSGLGTWRLNDDLRLSWDLESPEEGDGRDGQSGFGLAEAAESRLVAGEDDADRDERPQLFFFPSGESTPAQLNLELLGSERLPVRMRLSALSRVTVEEDD
ncbi:type II secretion system protein [Isoalcanivorax indicus]|uniref:type II secretion system protein n=1 Tax=Isoalcanivorax indicus TaxID=2202653 RepID=UPI0013C4220B|nr:type II secretion system protein [Isoalcanivorax indicus]